MCVYTCAISKYSVSVDTCFSITSTPRLPSMFRIPLATQHGSIQKYCSYNLHRDLQSRTEIHSLWSPHTHQVVCISACVCERERDLWHRLKKYNIKYAFPAKNPEKTEHSYVYSFPAQRNVDACGYVRAVDTCIGIIDMKCMYFINTALSNAISLLGENVWKKSKKC